MANRIAEELKTDRAVASVTKCVSVITLVITRCQADDRRYPAGGDPARPPADQYDTIIIDEAHERSLNIDFLSAI